jgi:penicillin G amidase
MLMRVIPFVISLVVTLSLVFALNTKIGTIPPLGKFLSPQQGFWQNAEPCDARLDEDLGFPGLKGKVKVYMDVRMVPHVFAENDEDVYFVQGYLHAKYRLFQMEFQTHAAAGRLSEILGNNPQIINYDRLQRRMGMVYGAENELKAVAKDALTQKVYDAYTAGVNSYINSLSAGNLPVEYKLLDFRPEPWTNLKIALFFKVMCSDLAGQEYAKDISFSNEKSLFSKVEMDMLYPQVSDSSVPIIPKGTIFESPSVHPEIPANADSFYRQKDSIAEPVKVPKPFEVKGSNNWVVSGAKTKSGAPILCNDPHLRLTLPSIWYEMQLHTPTMNVYGVGFPSVPGIVIGYNDSIAIGLTNAGRDVMDYYQVKFKDASRNEYWYKNQWQAAEHRIEKIKVKGGETIIDTVAYTVFGPVTYDRNFTTADSNTNTALAMRWTAHDPSNEVLTLIKLNRAKNYSEYSQAIKEFACPGQNIIFGSTNGDIAIWQQGKFPARWKNQGLYVMPGEDDTYSWQGFIPQGENPHMLNPPDNFLQSANQRAVDSSYPYFIPGDYYVPRGRSIYRQLSQMQDITPQDMMRLQGNAYSTLAEDAMPLFSKYLKINELSDNELKYWEEVSKWNFEYTGQERAPTIFQTWMDSLESVIWTDEFTQASKPVTIPSEQILLENLLRDSAFRFVDDINTPEKEDLYQDVTLSFKKAVGELVKNEDGVIWWKHRNTFIQHLLRDALPAFGRTGLMCNGWSTTINALTKTHGPSWRMVIHLTKPIEAYGVYPGGQSGNPGSKFYENFIDTWATGKYFTLWMMQENESSDKRIIGQINFTNS